jgi:hypothetical protein
MDAVEPLREPPIHNRKQDVLNSDSPKAGAAAELDHAI